MDTLEHLKCHLKGRVVVLGIGNTLRSDDGLGSILASRIQNKVSYTVYDSGANPENYLEKIIKQAPDTIVILDAADFGAKPGEFNIVEAEDIKTVNLFTTHNASISLTINYLKNNLKADIITLIVQPKSIAFGDTLSQEVADSIASLEKWFYETDQEKR